MEEEILQEKKTHGTYVSVFRNDNSIVTLRNSVRFQNFDFSFVTRFLRDVFLPQGYPSSVSSDYIQYQIWDTLQGFCSSLSGTLTTHAIFKGVGVGDQNATALAATVTWIMKDGTGMIGRIGFAWWKGYLLDTDCKKWRFVADVTNDVAMCVELLLGTGWFKDYGPILLCISTGMKSVVGVAGGATRAAVTQHQAVRGNMADVSAKDGSQETCVNLLASVLGVFILTCIESSVWCIWILFFSNAGLHVFANYKAVKSLTLKTLNTSRLLLVTKHYLQFNIISSPMEVNKKESVILGFGFTDRMLCSKKISLGSSLKTSAENKYSSINTYSLKKLKNIYSDFPYLILYDPHTVDVILEDNISDEEIIKAYFHALIIGIVTTWSPSTEQTCDFNDEVASLVEICHVTKLYDDYVNNFVERKWKELSTNLSRKGWNLKIHQLTVDDFRIKWY